MKRILLVLGFMVLAVGVSAQTMYDALRYSGEDYVGTARTMAMGNAVSSLGGDIGSININPAGSAVGSYSQVIITPGMNLSSSVSQGTTLSGQTEPFCFGNRMLANEAKFALPTLGLCFNYDTGRRFGVKSFALSLVADKNSYFLDNNYTSGVHKGTSIAGSIAHAASGITADAFNAGSAYDNYPWAEVVGWHSGMISTAGADGQYVGATEKYVVDESGNKSFFTAGPLNQEYGRLITGAKGNYIFNAAMNISDVVYVGFTVGLTTLNYAHDDYLKESPVDKNDFDVDFGDAGKTYFKSLKYQSWYSASGTGSYAKLGIIGNIGPVRVGAAIQSPTSTVITEKWGCSAQTRFDNSSFDGEATSPNGEYKYRLRSPWKFNMGISGTIGGIAILSADYEFRNNRSISLSPYDKSETNYFTSTNTDIANLLGATHQLRAGAEIRPLAWLSVRAGYVLNDVRCGYGKNSTMTPYQDMDHSVSGGLGFSTNGAFFFDIAFRTKIGHKEYIYPYDDYQYKSDGSILNYTPEILTRRYLSTALLTVGYRF